MKIQSQLYGNIKQFIKERIKCSELYGRYLTFSFTLDAFPGYTYFDKTKKVLCAIQIVDDVKDINDTFKTIFPHPSDFNIKESIADSIPDAGNEP